MKGTLLAVWVLVSGMGAVHADDCLEGASSQTAMNVCVEKSYREHDKELNAAFQKVLNGLEGVPSSRQRLREAQRTWVAFRDAECAFVGGSGGSAASMVVLQCMETLTKQRTEALTGYLNCEEGDLSCPVPIRR